MTYLEPLPRRRVAVLGGGMAGCIVAGELAKRGARVDLYERGDRLGGLHHSPVIDGRAYDIGAFFFDGTHQVFNTFPGLLDRFPAVSVRHVSVAAGGLLDTYPLSIAGYLRNHGRAHFAAALASIAWSKLRYWRRDTLAAFVRYYVGGVIYERSGLRAYIERLNSLPEAEIDVMFAEQRMGDLRWMGSLRAMVRRLFRPTRWQLMAHAPVALARPAGGFGEVYGEIERQLVEAGVGVHKSVTVSSIARHGGRFTLQGPEFAHRFGDAALVYDDVVSTAPAPVTARLAGVELQHRYETVNLLTLFYRHAGHTPDGAAIVFNFCPDGQWKRIIDFSRIYGRDGGGAWLAVEIPLRPGAADVDAERRAFEAHVAGLGLFDAPLAFQGSQITANAYPIFRANGIAEIERDGARLAETGIRMCGRQGRFEYVTSQQVAESAAALAADLVPSPCEALPDSRG